MTDHWGNVERFVLAATLLILVMLMAIVGNEVAAIGDWSTQQAEAVAEGFSGVALFAAYLGIKAMLGIYAPIHPRLFHLAQIPLAVAFIAIGVAFGQGIDRIAAVGVAMLFALPVAIETAADRLPQRWVDQIEAAVE